MRTVVVFAGVALGAWAGSPRVQALPNEAAHVDPKLFQELRWRSIGPARGGRTLAVTGVPGQPEVYYFGAVDGGVWRSNDAGRTWKPIFDGQSIASIGAIAVALSDPQVIYVGTGEADMRSDIAYGDGMYKSTDGGKSWTHIGLNDSRQIARILVDPNDPAKVYVAALGHAYGPNSERGVFRSNNGGETWQRVLFHDENTGAIDLAFQPGHPATIFAALLQTRRPPWNIYPPSKGPGSGVYRSDDGGDHWEHVTGSGLPSEGLGRVGIAFAPSNAQRIYLIMDAKDGGLYRSDDGGKNWAHVSNDKRIWGRGWYFCEVSVDSKDPDTVYVPNTGLYRSHDGGKTFTVIKGAPGGDDYHELWVDPSEPQRMILGSDQGAVVTRNAGETWSSWYNQPIGQFYHVTTDNRFPYWVYGAQQDSGAAATPSRSRYRSLNFHDWRPMDAGDENGYVATDPLNPEVIYGGFVTRQDLRNEQMVQMPPGLAQAFENRRTWTLPLVFSPRDPHVLYFGSQLLYRTADGGSSWQTISPDLTREEPGVPANLDPPTAGDAPAWKRRGVIYTIAPSFAKSGVIWAGTDDGLIQLTQDEGKTWKNVTPPELTPWSKVTLIETSHRDPGTAYAAVDRHRLEDLRPYLYRTRNFGKTWTPRARGIPEGSFLNCVREDSVVAGLLFACTERGVFVSFNDGDDWQPLQLNLPTTSVRDLVVHNDDLVIATHGRSFWILDDVTPLRELKSAAVNSNAWLFTPEVAYRVRPGTDQGTPVPQDEALAENPPDGAILDYYLKEKPAGVVTLEIFDAAGKPVRRFASDDQPAKTNPSEIPISMDWVRDEVPLSKEPGMHRFVWDLHYALPNGVHKSPYGPSGVWAVPGSYTAKLTVDGQSSSHEFAIKLDPRVKAADAALAEQFTASSLLAARLGELSNAMERAESLRKQLEERSKAGNSMEMKTALEKSGEKIGSMIGQEDPRELGLYGVSLPQAGDMGLRRALDAVSALLIIAEGVDAAPGSDARTAIAKWDAASKQTLARWSAMEAEERALVNAVLQKAGLQALRQ